MSLLPLVLLACLPSLPERPADGAGDSGVPTDTDTDTDADTDTDTDGGSDTGTDTDTDTDGGGDTGTPVDADDDGWTAAEDCDDSDPDVNPGVAAEICNNGKDDDCDGTRGDCVLSGAYRADADALSIPSDEPGDAFGFSLAGARTTDGDALLVGAPQDGNGVVRAFTDFSSDFTAGDAPWSMTGLNSGDQLGRSIAVGDLDLDGHQDVVMAGYAAVSAGAIATGSDYGPNLYAAFGPLEPGRYDADFDTDLTVHAGSVSAFHGNIQVAAGQAALDDALDVAIGVHVYEEVGGVPATGSRGHVFLLAEAPTGSPDLEGTAHLMVEGDGLTDMLGYAVAMIDVTGDGFTEIFAGAPGADGATSGSTGRVYVIEGDMDSDDTLASVGDVAVCTILGQGASTRLGVAVADIGDFDGDGVDDIAVGADGSTYDQPFAGEALVFTATQLDGLTDLDSDDAVLTVQGHGASTTAGSVLGVEIAGAGDLDDDDREDFLVGAIGAHVDGDRSGVAYLVGGGQTGVVETSPATELMASFEGTEGSLFGTALLGTYDFDDDDVFDIVVGGPGWSDGTGSIWLFPGLDY